MCDRWQIPIRRKVRSSKPSRATTAFSISRSRRQRAQGVAIKFQHAFNNHRAYAPAASLAYDGDTRPSCEMQWSTRNVSNGKTAPGCTDAPYSTKLSMRYPGKADHDPRGGPSFSACSVTMERRSRTSELATPGREISAGLWSSTKAPSTFSTRASSPLIACFQLFLQLFLQLLLRILETSE